MPKMLPMKVAVLYFLNYPQASTKYTPNQLNGAVHKYHLLVKLGSGSKVLRFPGPKDG